MPLDVDLDVRGDPVARDEPVQGHGRHRHRLRRLLSSLEPRVILVAKELGPLRVHGVECAAPLEPQESQRPFGLAHRALEDRDLRVAGEALTEESCARGVRLAAADDAAGGAAEDLGLVAHVRADIEDDRAVSERSQEAAIKINLQCSLSNDLGPGNSDIGLVNRR